MLWKIFSLIGWVIRSTRGFRYYWAAIAALSHIQNLKNPHGNMVSHVERLLKQGDLSGDTKRMLREFLTMLKDGKREIGGLDKKLRGTLQRR